jgi:hypothetical protein
MLNPADKTLLIKLGLFDQNDPFKIPENFRKINDIKIPPHKHRNVHTEVSFAITKDIKENGLLYPILITDKNVLINGFYRLKAHQELGFTIIQVTVQVLEPRRSGSK